MHWKLKYFLKLLHRNPGFSVPKSMEDYRSDLASTWRRNKWWLDGLSVSVRTVSDFSLRNREEVEIPIRKYQHCLHPTKVLFYLHGGGWVGRSIQTYDNVCRRLARSSNVLVYSIGYRLSPEVKFPKAIFDCVDVISQMMGNARFQVEDCECILLGDSAGGNMVVGISRELDRLNQNVDKAILLYPPLDTSLTQDSVDKFGRGYIIQKPDLEWMRDMYVPKDQSWEDPYLSPLFFTQLEFLPRTWILTAGYDPFQDDGILMAAKLKKVGRLGGHAHFKELTHGFSILYSLSPDIKKAYQYIYEAIDS